MSKKYEQKFITELKKSVIALNDLHGEEVFWYKIPDSPHLGVGARFDSPKPFDIFYVEGGDAYAIEAKVLDGYKAFGLAHMRMSQVESLTQFMKAGGQAYVALNIRQAASKAEGKEHINKAIFMPWDGLYARLKKSSIKAKELIDAPGIHGKKGLYNLEEYESWDPSYLEE
jgi:Holliday junction resolvase